MTKDSNPQSEEVPTVIKRNVHPESSYDKPQNIAY